MYHRSDRPGFLPPTSVARLAAWAPLLVVSLGWGMTLAAHAQVVRPGLWEFEGPHSRLQQGRKSVDMQKIQRQLDAQMRGMDPDARRMLEENLRSAGVVVAKGRSARLCVQAEHTQLARLAQEQQQDTCRFTLQERGPDFVRGDLQCTQPPAQGSFLSTLITPERLSNRSELKTSQGQLVIQSSAQWLAADCGDAPEVGSQGQRERSLFEGP